MTAHEPHRRYEELAVGHALHALEPEDELTFTAHLADCSRCADVVAETERVGAEFGGLAEPEEAPARVWEGISRRIADDGSPATPDIPVRALRPRRRWVRPLAAAAAVVLLAGAGVGAWRLVSPDQRPGVRDVVAGCLADARCRQVALSGRAGGAVQARLLVRGDQATIVATGLPSDDAARQTYVLWQLPADGKPVGLAAFHVVESGTHVVGTTRLSLPYAATTAFAVSLERGSGIPAAPSTPVAVGAATS